MLDRRQFVQSSLVGALGVGFLSPATLSADEPLKYPYTLPKLPVAFNALEPTIDAKTMEIHHGKHHQAYVDNLNKALAEHTALQALSLHDLQRKLADSPETVRTALRNHGGGHLNHAMFWETMRGPGVHGAGAAPQGRLAEAITKQFGDLDKFKTAFNDAGLKQFGSGWVFLVHDPKTTALSIVTRPNQDSPLIDGLIPVLGNDVWEHAYYLNYQNRRADYLKAWWNVVAWDIVAARYTAILAGKDA